MTSLKNRKDRTPTRLRKLAKAADTPRLMRRILAIANALDGMSREEAARSAGMDRQALRDWVLRYNEHGIDGLYDRWCDGRPPTYSAEEQAELMRIGLAGPDPEVSGLSANTLEDLPGICEQRFGKRMHPWALKRPLRRAPALLRGILFLCYSNPYLHYVFDLWPNAGDCGSPWAI